MVSITAARLMDAGACVGFIPYNRNPAKIFMGDTGSTFLGFVLATVSIQGLYFFAACAPRNSAEGFCKQDAPPFGGASCLQLDARVFALQLFFDPFPLLLGQSVDAVEVHIRIICLLQQIMGGLGHL